jgi:hypothetical protein
MSEFIREVDEEYRRDRILQMWKRYSGVFIALAILAVAGIGGWRYWQHAEERRAQEAAARYEGALRLSREGSAEEAERALQGVSADAPAGYRLLSRFRMAAEIGKRSPQEGAAAYDALAADGSVDALMQDLARLRAALLRMDLPDPAAAQAGLERIAVPSNPWRHTAREMLGLIGLRRGDVDAASRWFDQVAADPETPAGLRSRLQIYTALAAGGPVAVTQ